MDDEKDKYESKTHCVFRVIERIMIMMGQLLLCFFDELLKDLIYGMQYVEVCVKNFKRPCIVNNERKNNKHVMFLLDFLDDSALKLYKEYKSKHLK